MRGSSRSDVSGTRCMFLVPVHFSPAGRCAALMPRHVEPRCAGDQVIGNGGVLPVLVTAVLLEWRHVRRSVSVRVALR
ncbi:hypothetical protein E2C01_021779 [Portunus trituberculatus]|uniref:Uncharacterized protein n=1 Tax=Portunus trituberculatus TaxID=210409 RepID=A0A5B7E3M7_PORTR|nr:hypothetical protein [Portunus trituberculatus]